MLALNSSAVVVNKGAGIVEGIAANGTSGVLCSQFVVRAKVHLPVVLACWLGGLKHGWINQHHPDPIAWHKTACTGCMSVPDSVLVVP